MRERDAARTEVDTILLGGGGFRQALTKKPEVGEREGNGHHPTTRASAVIANPQSGSPN